MLTLMEKGWMIKIKLDNPSDFRQLLNSTDYKKIIAA